MTPSAHEERRIVTVLFADLAGFTSLAEHLDPEQVKRLVDGCFEHLVEDVNDFGGRVDKFLGDGILALFGAPVTHEDDPERAVRAALRMHDTLATYVDEADLDRHGELRLRVGINTGEVLVGSLAGGDYTALGDVVNTAQRLQAAAPVGGVLVGPLTHSLTSHSIRYDEGRSLQTKGRDQAIDVFVAEEAMAPPGAARRPLPEVRLIGRDTELAVARAALDTVASRRSVLVAISGDNGVGTTRMLDELVRYMRDTHHAVAYTAGGVPYGESNIWWPVAFALFRSFEIEPGTEITTVRATLATRSRLLGAEWDEAECQRVIDGLVHVLGYPSPIDALDAEPARQEIRHAVTQAFELRACRHPLVLAIDDFHWVDPGVADVITHLLQAMHQRPLAVITATRLGTEIDWPPHSDRVPVVSVPLEPLSRADTDLLATELLGEDEVTVRRLAGLYERSGGNPLFLHELAALAEHTGEQQDLPATLRSLVGARLEQLTVGQRRIVDNAATLGTSGPVHDLEVYAAQMDQVFDVDDLDALHDTGILEVHDGRWRFRSESVRDAAYQTLTKASRAQRHAGVAAALARAGNDYRLDDLAHHLATAAELAVDLGGLPGLEGIVDEAIDALSAAALRAANRGSFRLATRDATKALDLLANSDDDARRLPLLVLRAGSRSAQRLLAAAAPDIEEGLAIADRLGDAVSEGVLRRLKGNLASSDNDLATARVELDESIALLRAAGETERLADALRSRGWVELFGGSVIDAERYFAEAEEIYSSAGDERGMAWVSQHRAWASFLAGDLSCARAQLITAEESFARLGDHNGLGWAGGIMAFIAFLERDYAEAERLAQIVSETAEAHGDEWAAGIMQVLLANLALWEHGQLGEAERLATSAARRMSAINDQWGTLQALAPLVRAQIALGHLGEARHSIEQLRALSALDTTGAFPFVALAGAAMHRGRGADALDLCQRAANQMRIRHMIFDDVHSLHALGLLQQRRFAEAVAEVEQFPARLLAHPFGAATAALTYALSGETVEARKFAEIATSAKGSTYFDDVLAYLAAAEAASLDGDAPIAVLSLEAAVARALAVGDVIATALATSAFQRIVGRPHPAADEAPLGRGWERVIHQLTPLGTSG